jgi:hypothetical protein
MTARAPKCILDSDTTPITDISFLVVSPDFCIRPYPTPSFSLLASQNRVGVKFYLVCVSDEESRVSLSLRLLACLLWHPYRSELADNRPAHTRGEEM